MRGAIVAPYVWGVLQPLPVIMVIRFLQQSGSLEEAETFTINFLVIGEVTKVTGPESVPHVVKSL